MPSFVSDRKIGVFDAGRRLKRKVQSQTADSQGELLLGPERRGDAEGLDESVEGLTYNASSERASVDNRRPKRNAIGRHGKAIACVVGGLGLEECRRGREHGHLADKDGRHRATTCKGTPGA